MNEHAPEHALSIDVEDYFHVTAFESVIDRAHWPTLASRVVRNTQMLLEILARRTTRGTFFVLGWIAERFPELVREIAAAGHEIASHGYEHRRIYQQTPAQFRHDVRQSRERLEEIIGEPVTMYRAPTFSITSKSLWALEILAEEGYTLDASIFPIRHDRYGMPSSPTHLHKIETPSGPLWEFPPAVVRVARARVPIGGGGYFRLLPGSVHRGLWRRCARQIGGPLMFYLHPWEIDPQQPRVAGASWLSQTRHRLNLHSTAHKLDRLLREFRFGAISDVLPERSANAQCEAATTTA